MSTHAATPVRTVRRPDSTAEKPQVGQFGLPTATALVIGSVIGTGVFALPSALAPYGPISLVAFVLVTVGALALALALTFGALSKQVPGSGGPYVYARDAFGDFAGFLNAWFTHRRARGAEELRGSPAGPPEHREPGATRHHDLPRRVDGPQDRIMPTLRTGDRGASHHRRLTAAAGLLAGTSGTTVTDVISGAA
jgi:hypothetical protein